MQTNNLKIELTGTEICNFNKISSQLILEIILQSICCDLKRNENVMNSNTSVETILSILSSFIDTELQDQVPSIETIIKVFNKRRPTN